MNKIRISFFIVGAALALASSSLHAQTSIQRLTFSLVGEYQTNTFYTNPPSASGPWTSEFSEIRPILVTSANVIKSLALDLEGSNYTMWTGAELVREVNLTNGHEGIFIRKGENQTNVSSFFGGTYSNDFKAGLTNAFPAFTNNISGLSNDLIGSTNYGSTNYPTPQTLLYHGWLRRDATDTNSITTNYTTTAGLFYVSLNTTNIKFNLVASGEGSVTAVPGSIDSTPYESTVDAEYLGTAGTFYLNIATNIYATGSNSPLFVTGPMHGTINSSKPTFSTIQGP